MDIFISVAKIFYMNLVILRRIFLGVRKVSTPQKSLWILLLLLGVISLFTGCSITPGRNVPRQSYSGAEVAAMAGNLTMDFGENYPETVSAGGDKIPLAGSVYLMAQWLLLFAESGGTNEVTGTVPELVPYKEIKIPKAVTPGKKGGVVVWSDLFTAAGEIVAALDDDPQIPDEITVRWREGGNWGDIQNQDPSEEVIGIDMVISLFARTIVWADDEGTMPNYGIVKGGNLPASWPGEEGGMAKGIWILGSTARTHGVDTVVDTCGRHGITDILLMVKGSDGQYRFDVLEELIEKAQPWGIKTHAWAAVLYDRQAAASGDFDTVGGNWIDARDEGYRQYFLENIITPLANNYDIDGIHLDYIRYPGNAANYSGSQAAITSYCCETRNLMNTGRPEAILSAAIMPEAGTAQSYGQNVAQMSDYTQLFVLMTYTDNYGQEPSWVGTQTAYFKNLAGPESKVWAGIQTIFDTGAYMPAQEMQECLAAAASAGTDGIAYFRYPLASYQWEESDNW